MRVIGVTPVLNEAALVEPFIRHHAELFDQHIILDNGSTDDTLPILRRLHAEGLGIAVYESVTATFVETIQRTGLYRLGVAAGADWVMLLDCDELLDTRRLARGWRQWLADQPPGLSCLHVPMLDYVAASPASASEPLLFQRLTRRRPSHNQSKVLVRGLAVDRVVIGAGSHAATVDGVVQPENAQDRVTLAHYPQRSPAQMALKAAIGRLKVLADGSADVPLDFSRHLTEPFEAIKRAPRQWLLAAAQWGEQQQDLIEDPGPYRGAELHYSLPPDDDARLVALLMTYAERLARSHGALLDEAPGLRDRVLQRSAIARRLF